MCQPTRVYITAREYTFFLRDTLDWESGSRSRSPDTTGRRPGFFAERRSENVRYAQRNAEPSKRNAHGTARHGTGNEGVRARSLHVARYRVSLSLSLSFFLFLSLSSLSRRRRPPSLTVVFRRVGVDFPTEFPPSSFDRQCCQIVFVKSNRMVALK